jgi:hypothetical protein
MYKYFLKFINMNEYLLSEDLAVWFGKKKKPKGSSQPKGPWVNICSRDKDGKHPPCGRPDADSKAYPKCRAAGVAGKMSDSEKKAACRQKRAAEKKDTQTGKGQKPVMTSYKPKNESMKESIIRALKKYKETPLISEELQYHLENDIPVSENVFRPGSQKYFNLINEARELKKIGIYENEFDNELLNSDLGKFFIYEGERLPLDYPMINEAEYKGKNVELGKPKSGGPKKWYVYVKNPQSGKIVKVTYGSPVMTAKWNDSGARASFAARHQCEKKKDRTKPGYWACRAHKDFGNNVPGRYW